MKDTIKQLVRASLTHLQEEGVIDAVADDIRIESTRDPSHGDFACNVAMTLAKQARCAPRELAERIVAGLPGSAIVDRVEIAGPGFINFFLKRGALHATIPAILELADRFGRADIGEGKRVLIEFVSANPTGPLHIGHGRGAAYGAAIANLLEATGFDVFREYYVNDAGRQMDILAVSVWLRYLALGGNQLPFPENGYRGDYVLDIAKALHEECPDRFIAPIDSIAEAMTGEEDAERRMDALIAKAMELLGEDRYHELQRFGLERVLNGIRDDLAAFGVEYDNWFSERSMSDDQSIQRAIERLAASGHVYKKDGATWFNASAFGDEKDRVVVRDNGQTTYFASDIAYHLNKLERGFDKLIDIWGADHHGYVPRVRAALSAMGEDPNRLEILLVQFATLYRGKERLQMSTRAGEFVTLRALFEEVGTDAARFFYVMRRCEQHLEFDLELAQSQSAENPVYYVQYAHARVCSVFRQLEEKGHAWDPALGNTKLELLTEPHEQALITTLSRYPDLLASAALNREPHQVANYLRDLANDFHTFYNAHQFIVDAAPLRNARLNLIAATRQVIRNALQLLGVSAPEKM